MRVVGAFKAFNADNYDVKKC